MAGMRLLDMLVEGWRLMTPDYTAAILRLGNIGAVALGGTLCAVVALLAYALVM